MKLREATDVIVMAVSAVSAFAIRRRDRMRKYDVFFGRKSSKHRNLTHFFGEEKYVFCLVAKNINLKKHPVFLPPIFLNSHIYRKTNSANISMESHTEVIVIL